jgi:hypothetical protein
VDHEVHGSKLEIESTEKVQTKHNDITMMKDVAMRRRKCDEVIGDRDSMWLEKRS